jgi:GNAT superfamily N-acetyltransferase
MGRGSDYDATMDATISPATTDADLERVLDVRNAIEVEKLTLVGLRAERSAAVASLDLVAETGGRDVGAGSIAWGAISVESRNVFIFAWVLPEERHRGIGGRLLDQLVACARTAGMERMTTLVYADDTDAIAFIERRGLVVDGGGQLGKLDLAAAPVERGVAPIPGVEVAPLAERLDLEHELYDLDMLIHPEVPFLADEPLPSFESWRATGTGDPGFLPELSLVAIEGGRLIGAVQLYDNGDQVAFIGMTNVHPDARRRGVARLLKVELERRARAAGLRRIETYNDGTNERIRGLNESLGYVYNPPYVALRGPLPVPRGADVTS